jgi:exonuclease SbcC
MRPHELRVTAFGAFAHTVEIHLDALAESGLFLLHGETGAGKTTLLDAIGFALYGRVPGERGRARRLRSDHSTPATRTEVQLEATVGDRRLRLTRSPEQNRPKMRGAGMTREPARVLLEEHVDGGWRTLSTRLGEADAEIADLMGMSAEQFFQVVLLPQGEFARFLHASSEDRGKLLERLFGTDRFRAVEQWLAEQRRVTARRVDDAQRRIAELAARVAQVADVQAPVGQPDTTWAPGLAAAATAASADAQAVAGGCERALDAALGKQGDAEQLADRQRRRLAAHRLQGELAAAGPQIEALRRELAAATRAAEVASTLKGADRTAARLAKARAEEESARTAAVAVGAAPDTTIDALRAAAKDRQRQVGRLETLRELADRAAAEDTAARGARHRAGQLAQKITVCAQLIDDHAGQRADLSAARDSARYAAQRLPDVRAEAERHAAAAAAADALAGARTDQQRLSDKHIDARQAALTLRERAHQLRVARFDSMIAELAAGLVEDTPCPVCGALDHPDPSELRADRVTYQQEEQATAEAEMAQARAEELGQQLAAAIARAEELIARLSQAGFTEPDRTGLKAAAKTLAADASGLAAAAARLADHDTALATVDEAVRETEKQRTSLAEQRRSALDEATAADRRAADYRASLLAQLDGAPDLETALAVARAAAAALFTAADAATAVLAARDDADRAAGTADEAARTAGFGDGSAARTAGRSIAWRDEAQATVDQHREHTAAVQTLLADPDLDVPVDPPAEVAATAAAVKAARAAHEIAVASHERACHRAAQLTELGPELSAALADLAPLADQIRRLADLTAGQGANTLRMTLSSFVLASRLEEVAAIASERLLRMTQGRYSLVHTDTGRGGARAGLGLLARDAWTGQDRDTSTLSGGETFLASLALALGLADVVTAEAGGTRIEALFVDEGFGSLDDETLDEVMNVLDGLRAGGRIVGIVSHVAELRQRIPTQVHVRKSRTGSDIAIVAA